MLYILGCEVFGYAIMFQELRGCVSNRLRNNIDIVPTLVHNFVVFLILHFSIVDNIGKA